MSSWVKSLKIFKHLSCASYLCCAFLSSDNCDSFLSCVRNYFLALKTIKTDIRDISKRVDEFAGIKEQPLQVARGTKIITTDSDDPKYIIQVKFTPLCAGRRAVWMWGPCARCTCRRWDLCSEPCARLSAVSGHRRCRRCLCGACGSSCLAPSRPAGGAALLRWNVGDLRTRAFAESEDWWPMWLLVDPLSAGV